MSTDFNKKKDKIMKKLDKIGEQFERQSLDKDPKRADLEMRLLGINERIKKEGIKG